MRTHDNRLATAREILDGLSVGDAIGESLSYQHYRARELADFSMFRPGTVPYTDDTEMAVTGHAGTATIPADWIRAREPLRFTR